MREHPDHGEFNGSKDRGPAIIEFQDGTSVYAENLVYTTAIKYTSDGVPQTTKAPAIKRIVYVESRADYEKFLENDFATTDTKQA